MFGTRQARYVDLLRELSLDEAQLSGEFRVEQSSAWDTLVLPHGTIEVELQGWLLVDGRPPDAVLADVGAGPVPLLARKSEQPRPWDTKDAANLFAGVSGKVSVAPDADVLRIEAYDRTAGVRAVRTTPIRRR